MKNDALTVAAGAAQHRCLDMLLAARANVDAEGNDGQTPLMLVATKGASTCLKALLQAGAEVDKQSHKGETAVALAASTLQHTCLKLLVSARATVDLVDRDGKTPFMLYLKALNTATEGTGQESLQSDLLDCLRILADARQPSSTLTVPDKMEDRIFLVFAGVAKGLRTLFPTVRRAKVMFFGISSLRRREDRRRGFEGV